VKVMAAAMPSRANSCGKARLRQASRFPVKSQTSIPTSARGSAEYGKHALSERQQLACEGEAEDNAEQQCQDTRHSYDRALSGAAVDAM
jgi:hypothetical protein